ncbi:ABC-2 type transport system permease protein [Kitasatospora gansuensis]|uniref:Transport permease protein n=1 Tax=Kitasatospora gansuensis TaxID=258050 RepID=A0A7W7WIK7_9ACTN|nr:ABC transporter permease [Kitasatospora gansuensis]MBB4948313.1 ABC-2 type transport system permease protein [Kitasatospora gansuensis]
MSTPTTTAPGRTLAWPAYARGQFLLSWRVFWRNRRSTFIGFLLPVLLNLVIAAPLRDQQIAGVNAAAYSTVGFIGFALVTSFINLLNGVVARRDDLVLKRLRGTEVPPTAIFAGQFGAAGAVVLLQVLVLGGLSVIWFDAPLPADPLLFLLTLTGGFLLFAVLAVALSGLTPSAEAAPMIATPVLLICMFASGVVAPLSSMPHWLQAPAHNLPMAPVVETLRTAWFGRGFGPESWNGAPLPALDLLHAWQHAAPALLIIAAWTAGAAVLGRRLFRWEPRHG